MLEDFADGQLDSDRLKGNYDKLFQHATAVDAECNGLTAGVNAAHRVPALGFLCSRYPWQEVAQAARLDSGLTHVSEMCRETCACVALLCGELAMGRKWEESLRTVATRVSSCFPVQNALLEGMDPSCRPHLSRGGYCVDVLKAAVHFVTHTTSFESALLASTQFAGPANYAPVLVGAFAGALYGCESIDATHLRHWERDELNKTDRLLCSLAAMLAKLNYDAVPNHNS